MFMDFGFFKELLSINSTSGKERKVAEWLAGRLPGMFPAANRPALREPLRDRPLLAGSGIDAQKLVEEVEIHT